MCVKSALCVCVCVQVRAWSLWPADHAHTQIHTHQWAALKQAISMDDTPEERSRGTGRAGRPELSLLFHTRYSQTQATRTCWQIWLIYRFQTYLYVLVFWFHHHRLLSFSNATCLSLCSAAMQLLSRPYRWSDEQWLKSTSGEVKVFGEVMCCFVCKLCSVFKCIKAAELWLICTKSDTIPSCSTLYFIMLYCCLIKNLNLKLTYVSTSFLYIQIIPWITFYLSSSAVQKIQLMIIFTVIKSTKY